MVSPPPSRPPRPPHTPPARSQNRGGEGKVRGHGPREPPIPSSLSWVTPLHILVGIILFGAILRLMGIGDESLWLDEVSTLVFARMEIPAIWTAIAAGEFNPPLFYWGEHIMVSLFGEGEIALRILPALAGIATIPVWYMVGNAIRGPRLGLALAVLLAVLPFHIQYSQEARAYTLALLTLSLAIYCTIRVMATPKEKVWWVAGALATVAACYTHFYTFVLALPLVVYLAVFYRSCGKRALPGIAVFILGMIPLLTVLGPLILLRTGSPPSYGIQGIAIIPATLMAFAGENGFVLACAALAFLVGILLMCARDARLAFAVTVFSAIAWASTVPLSFVMPMLPRYLIVILPLLALPIAYAATSVRDWRVSTSFIVTAMVILALPLGTYYTSPQKEDWRGYAGRLSAWTQPGDTVLAVPTYILQPLGYYYTASPDGTRLAGASDISTIQAYLSPGHRTFLVVTPDIYAVPGGQDVVTWATQEGTIVAQERGIATIVLAPGSVGA